MLVTSLLLFGLYFGYANAAGPTATKQFEGVWKPAQFFKADYELGGLKEIPLAEVLGGNGETYLHFKGNKVCSGGILEGSRKKLCSDATTGDAIFREFFSTPLTRGGTQINVWADDEKIYTIPRELILINGKLKETFGDGSEKMYEKVKNISSSAKKNKAKKKTSSLKSKNKESSPTSKLQGTWRVIETYGSSSFDGSGPFTALPLREENIFEITFRGDAYCDSRLRDVVDETKVFCEPITVKADGTLTGLTGSRLEAFGGHMQLNGSKLEFYEGGKGFMKFVLEKKK